MDRHRSWGLSTPDHHYSAAQIDGNGEYRITGKKGRTVDYCFEILSGLVGDDGVPGERIDALEVGGIQIEAEGTFDRSAQQTSELPSPMSNSYAVLCLDKKQTTHS